MVEQLSLFPKSASLRGAVALLCLAAWSFLATVGPVSAAGRTLAVQPCWDPEKALGMFQPLADYLSRQIGEPVSLKLFDTPEQFHQEMAKADFIIQDAFSAFVHDHALPTRVLAKAVFKNGRTVEQGALIVRKDSDIRSIEDLKGKSVLFGARHNTPKFFCAWILLRKHGIDPERDLARVDYGSD